MTVPVALVTPEQLSAATQGKVLATDPRVQPLLDGATAAIRRWCGWHIAPPMSDEVITKDGPGTSVLQLPTLHMTALTALVEDGVILDVATIEKSALGNLRKPYRVPWTDTYGGIVATITHGYDDAPDVAQIIIQVCANALASPMGATREQAIGFAASWSSTAPGVAGGMSLLKRDLEILATYRLRGA